MNEAPSIRATSLEATDTGAIARMQGINKWYGAFHALRDIDLQVESGERIVICGPSGSGKSTLVRTVNLLEPFQQGSLEVCGIRVDADTITRAARRAINRRVAMVFQQFNLFPHLTALDNITLAPRVVKRAERAAAESRAHALLAQVGLADRAGAYPHELSGGQQQRVAIARALAQEPDVMLFDEPTSALDPEMRDDVMEVVRGLARAGMTMLVVTHEMQFAHDIASRVWVIDQGTIAEDGPPARVVDHPETAVAREFFSRIRRT